MRISVTEAAGRLPDLLRRAEAGEEIVLTDDGRPVGRLAAIPPVEPAPSGRASPEVQARRRAIIEAAQREAAEKALPGPDAAHSQDFLYDEDGLPG